MDCITLCAVDYPVAQATPYGIPSELLGILREHGKLYATFSIGSGSRIVACKPRDLASFASFRRHVRAELGVLLEHYSAGLPTHALRRGAWVNSVRHAHRRGRAA